MDASARAMVEAIHATPTQAVLYLSGGASQVHTDNSIYVFVHALLCMMNVDVNKLFVEMPKWSN